MYSFKKHKIGFHGNIYNYDLFNMIELGMLNLEILQMCPSIVPALNIFLWNYEVYVAIEFWLQRTLNVNKILFIYFCLRVFFSYILEKLP